MIIKKIVLNNIRSYEHQEIQFPIGSVLLSGDIGSGKSSILLAIEFALFGLKSRELTPEMLLRHGSHKGYVELFLNINGKNVIIRRNLKRQNNGIKQTEGYLIIDGVKKELSPVELRAVILDLIGYPKDLLRKSYDYIFRFTVYTPQEEMKRILLESKDKRLETLRKVFGIDEYKRIKDNVVILQRHLNEEMAIIESKLEDIQTLINEKNTKTLRLEELKQLISKLTKELDELNTKYLSMSDEYQKKKTRLEELKNQKLEYEKKLSEIKAKTEELTKLTVQEMKLKKEIEDLNTKIKDLNYDEEKLNIDVTHLESKLEEREKKFNDVTKEKQEIDLKLKSLKEKKDFLNDRKSRIKLSYEDLIAKSQSLSNVITRLNKRVSEITKVDEQIKQLQDKLSKTEQSLYYHNREINDIKNKVNNIISMNKCPLCKQPVTAEHKKKLTEQLTKNISVLKQKIAELSKSKDKIKEDLESLAHLRDEIIEKKQDIIQFKAEKENTDNLIKELKEILSELKHIDEELVRLNERKTLLDNINIKAIEDEIKVLKSEIKKYYDNKLKYEKYKSLLELINTKKSELSRLSDAIQNIRQLLNQQNKTLEALKKVDKDIQTLMDQITGLEQDMTDIKEIIKLKEIERANNKKELEMITKEVEDLNKRINLSKALLEKKKKYKELYNWLRTYFIGLVDNLEKVIFSRIYQEFNELFVKWFRILIPDEALNVRLDDSFSPIIEQNGYESSYHNLSGGEKTSVALAYRLALNKVINDLVQTIKTKDIIILDEPTDGFSTEQLDKLRDVLEQLNTKQTIIVSHEPNVEGFVDHIIRVVKKANRSQVMY